MNNGTPNPPQTATATTSGRISFAGEQDLYSFVANSSGSYRITSSGTFDTFGYLYNSNMAEIGRNDDDAGNRQFLMTANLTAGGKYFIKVRAFSNTATGSYGLRVSGPAPSVNITSVNSVPATTYYPDLIPTSILYNSNDLAVGRQIFIDSGIRNAGNAGSGSFIINWYVNDVLTVYSGHSSVPANSTVSDGNSGYNWIPPSAGTYVIKFVVDADNRIAESNENNNSNSVTVNVPPAATEQNADADRCILYQDTNYGGDGYAFSIGEYPDPGPCGFPNDFFSSVQIGSGVMLIVYEHSFFGGEWEVFTGNDDNLCDNLIGNDRISSVKVVSLGGETTGSSVTQPGTPANLRQTNVTGNTANLEWNSVSGAENYQIFESTNNSDWWSAGHSDNSYCQVNGLSPNMTYYFKVRAHNSAGDSDFSSSISVRTNSSYQ